MNILVTGRNSFLFQALLSNNMFGNDNLYEYEYGVDYTNIDRIYHFGSPSNQDDFEDKSTSAVSMIDYTVKIVEQALANKASIVFASSCGVEDIVNISTDNISNQDRYHIFKLTNEEYIKSFDPIVKSCILRIPRVYDLDRKVGLVGKLLKNEVTDKDMKKYIKFITVDDFITFADESITDFNNNDERQKVYSYTGGNWCCQIGQVINNLKIYWGGHD